MAAPEPASSYKVKERLKSRGTADPYPDRFRRLCRIRRCDSQRLYQGPGRGPSPETIRSDGEESKKRIILEGEFERSDFA